MAACRPWTPSLRQALWIWKLMVLSVRPRIIPISQLVLPSAAHCRHDTSRCMSGFMGDSSLYLRYYLHLFMECIKFYHPGKTVLDKSAAAASPVCDKPCLAGVIK